MLFFYLYYPLLHKLVQTSHGMATHSWILKGGRHAKEYERIQRIIYLN